MSFVWTLAETRSGAIHEVSFELLARGRPLVDAMETKLAAVVLGYKLDDEAIKELIERGADEVYVVDHADLAEFICESHSRLLAGLIKTYNPSVVLAAATTQGRTLMPHLAVAADTGLTADCTELEIEAGTDNLLQTRPAIGGNIMATIRTPNHRPQMATVRPKSTRPLPRNPERVGKIISVPVDTSIGADREGRLADERVRRVGFRTMSEGFGGLDQADVVVAGGRGLKTADAFALIEELAAALGGVVGASREAVERGWISYAHQVGLSDRTISAKLYIAVGISGSIQHLAGIKTCETIVSINSDPEAPIHQLADYAIVGDLFEVVPALTVALATALGRPSGGAQAKPAEPEPALKPAEARGEAAVVGLSIVNELEGIVGASSVIVDPELLDPYSHDETSGEEYAHFPDVVVKPATTEQVAEVVKLANRERIPITPRGAGSGLSGGAVPSAGGIVLSLERMNRLLEIDVDNMAAVVEAGMVTNDFAQAVKERGLFFAGYPMSLESCFIGGNIAENAGGGKAIKYGVTGRYVLGLELVTPTGEIVWLGGKASKDVSGYDIKQLVVGSEGTLGIVTKAIIRLTGLPQADAVLLALFDTPEAAIAAVPVITSRGIVPASIEFMDRLTVQTSCAYLNENLPYEECGAMLLIEVDGPHEDQVRKDLFAVGDLCEECGATAVYVAEDATTKERIWSVRRNIAEALKVQSPVQSLEDIVVPTAQIPDLIPHLERMSVEYGMQIPCYGHAGDGNLHATLVKSAEMDLETWRHKEIDCLRDLYRVVADLGGKISGEHGIGIKRKKYLAELVNPAELELMRAIKRAWDPNNIMNPGKIFDLEAERG